MYHTRFPFWLLISLLPIVFIFRYLILMLAKSNRRLNKFVSSNWPSFIVIFILSILSILLNFKQITPIIIFWYAIFNLILDAIIFWLNTTSNNKK